MNKMVVIALFSFLTAVSGLAQTQYEFINIGTFGGSMGSANDINNQGQVVGQASYPDNRTRAFLWEDGTMTDLGTLGGPNSGAFAINDAGQIVGFANTNNFSRAFILENGNMTEIGTFGGPNSLAYDINNSGQVVGVADTLQHPNKRAFIFEGDSLRFLGTLGGYESWAYAINNSGQVVGTARDTDQVQRPFLWDNGQMIGLGNLRGEANDINSDRKIVGSYVDVNGQAKAFMWENGIITDLGTLGGNNSVAQGINDLGQVVGYSEDANGTTKAFIWENGVMTDLNTLTTSLPLVQANSINNLNQIVGGGGAWLLNPGEIISGIGRPSPYVKRISGETYTISWTGPNWNAVNIKCITNVGTPLQGEIIIAQGTPLNQFSFDWDIPDNLFSYRTKIIVENADNISETIESGIFRIKPYVLTRVNIDSTYYDYRKNRDQWGFENAIEHMWPPQWWLQFDYNGIDPFTGSQYSRWQADGTFVNANIANHPDWISWVNTFTADACYYSTFLGIYKSDAVLKWKAWRDPWGGSCFGIAIANALAFRDKNAFRTKYPEFPNFVNPLTVASNEGVKKVINELYTHQKGNPHLNYRRTIGLNKTPKETLIELIDMFKDDNAQVRTLSFNNNGGGGGHAILAYGLEKDGVNPNIFYVKVYDNSYPDSINRIVIDTSANGGIGSWDNPDWPGWGGDGKFYLRDPAIDYLNIPTMSKGGKQNSPFILEDTLLQIFNPVNASVQITDSFGNITGFINNNILNDIPNSSPLIVDNGSETPPYGYSLTTDNYSVNLDGFTEDTIEVFFFTGSKSFSYERYGAEQNETDKLFFDGGISITNPDAQTKTIKLLNLINETTQEKLTVIRSLELAQNDSVKIENPDSNKVKLISYGSAKHYDVELNYITENGVGRFGSFDIQLTGNTSHTFIPEWTTLSNTELQILVDIGNDGIIDDTLSLKNEVTGIKDESSLLSPDGYNLAQNYPNPFNPVTTIQYSIPQRSNVTFKVYDILGKEVTTLVNEEKERGVYSITFDAANLASGIYIYQIQAGTFSQVKKMILLR